MKYLLFMELSQLYELRSDLESALAKVDALIDAQAELMSAPAPAAKLQAMPRTKAIEWILEDAKPNTLRPVEIWAALQMAGRTDPKMEVQVTTFDLWERGRIGKSGRGQYHAL